MKNYINILTLVKLLPSDIKILTYILIFKHIHVYV